MQRGTSIEGAFLTVYGVQQGRLHIFLLESLVRDDTSHPLHGRLISLAIIAIISLLADLPESEGVYLIEPHPELMEHYRRYGFELLAEQAVMYAPTERLMLIQQMGLVPSQTLPGEASRADTTDVIN